MLVTDVVFHLVVNVGAGGCGEVGVVTAVIRGGVQHLSSAWARTASPTSLTLTTYPLPSHPHHPSRKTNAITSEETIRSRLPILDTVPPGPTPKGSQIIPNPTTLHPRLPTHQPNLNYTTASAPRRVLQTHYPITEAHPKSQAPTQDPPPPNQ